MLQQETIIPLGTSISSADLYNILENTARATNSRLDLIYERVLKIRPGEASYIGQQDATGSIARNDLELSIKVFGAYYAPGTNWMENSFDSIQLSEPFGWKSGSPSDEDRNRLADYKNEVSNKLRSSLTYIRRVDDESGEGF